jgi:D-amino-acid dehydrogenase
MASASPLIEISVFSAKLIAMSRHVVIIGAGVIGLSCAHYAIRRGWKVTVVERMAAVRNGCSFGNAGMVVPSHFTPLAAPGMVALGLRWMWNPESPFYIKPRFDMELFKWAYQFWRSSTKSHVDRSAPLLRDLSLQSRQCFVELDSQGLDFGLHQNGLLMLCRTDKGLEEEAHAAERAHELGMPAQVLNRKAVQSLDPGVTMNVTGGVWYPQDCHLSPQRYVAALQSSIVDNGGTFRWNTAITGWRKESERLVAVATTAGDIEADEFILCGGSWSPETVAALGLRLPMQAGKGYSLTLHHPRQLPTICAILTEARIAVTPMNGQLRFGGTMELAGLDETINLRRVQGIIRSIPDYYPEFKTDDFAEIEPWQGLRPCSPDGLPYIGRSDHWKNLTIATGHAMMGLSLAPITGKLVSQLICGDQPDIASDLLSPDRFNSRSKPKGVLC